jgi:hypothetical protein
MLHTVHHDENENLQLRSRLQPPSDRKLKQRMVTPKSSARKPSRKPFGQLPVRIVLYVKPSGVQRREMRL